MSHHRAYGYVASDIPGTPLFNIFRRSCEQVRLFTMPVVLVRRVEHWHLTRFTRTTVTNGPKQSDTPRISLSRV